MTAGDQLARLELLLGDCCPLPADAGASGKLIELLLSSEALCGLAKYWLELPYGSRPKLRGLAVLGGANGDKQIQFIVDIGGRSPLVLFAAPLLEGKELPRFSAIWPYAAWWEEETRFFEKVTIEAGGAGVEVAWQRN